jgi:hypothetical protein
MHRPNPKMGSDMRNIMKSIFCSIEKKKIIEGERKGEREGIRKERS